MRLRQLARKLDVSPSKIIQLLSANGHSVENDPNYKLTDDQETIILSAFSIEEPSEIEQSEEPVIAVAEEAPEISSPPAEAAIEEEVAIPQLKTVTPAKPEPTPEKPAVYSLLNEEEEKNKDLELIKAPKIELEGLKVVGKIDLPAPKEKAKKEASTQEKAQGKNNRTNSRATSDRRRTTQRKPQLNPIELEKKKAERDAKRKQAEENKRLKALREKRYKEKVQSKTQTTKKKKKAKAAVQSTAAPNAVAKTPKAINTKPKPKGLKRIWAWLNGEFDKP